MIGRVLAALLVPASLAAQDRSGGYVVTQGGVEIVRERYEFDGTELTTTMRLHSAGLTIKGTTRYDDGLVPIEFVATGHVHEDSAAFQTLEVVFADSAAYSVSGANPQQGTTPLRKPYTIFRNLDFAHLSIALLRYDRDRGGSQEIQLWIPDGAVVVPLAMELSGDEGELRLQGVPIQVQTFAGGWLRRAEIPVQGVVVEWVAYVDTDSLPQDDSTAPEMPASVQELPHSFAAGQLTLEGTLTMPTSPTGALPVGVIVAGSGPTDRDGNSPPSLRTDMYRQLAWRLAERGIATLRYDKRGLGGTRGAFDPSLTTFEDFADDVGAAVRSLGDDPRFSKVLILGHSEGARLATLAVNRGASVAGIVAMAGAGRPVLTVLTEQLERQLDAAMLHLFDSLMAEYLDGEELREVPAALRPLLAPVNRRFMQTSVVHDAAELMSQVEVPVLIVQGETDLQVSVRDAEALHVAHPGSRLVIIAEANHVFKRTAERNLGGQMVSYIDPSLPVVPELVDAIVDWVTALP